MGRVLVRRRPPPTEIASGTPAVMTWAALDAGAEQATIALGQPPNLVWQARDASVDIEVAGAPASMSWTALDAKGEGAVFDPASLALDGWWRDYDGSPWSGTTSAGSSGTRAATAVDAAPSADVLNEHGVASMSSDALALDGTLDTYADAQAWSGWMLVNIATTDFTYLLQHPESGRINLYAMGGVAYAEVHDGSSTPTVSRDIATAAWQLIAWRYRHDGQLQLGVSEVPGASGGDSVVTTSTNITPRTNAVHAGGAGTFKLAEMGIARAVLTDQNFTDVKSYINARYGLSL